TEIIERTNSIITGDGGTVIEVDRWGMRKLAYEIKKEVQGYYVYVNYAAPGKTVDEIERIFRIDDRLLRYLTIKLADSMDQAAIEKEQQRIAARSEAGEEQPEAEAAAPAAESGEATAEKSE
ncbi:MAG TPA: 30S ribosomal protein S6, partial [Desulfobulbus sp.]|nr:30S ribosomal protein S6 [Desulfobulbus sp.]